MTTDPPADVKTFLTGLGVLLLVVLPEVMFRSYPRKTT